ncbi:hypothetical protein DFA_06409 [Cavenderia fasciculata]|uniref:Uncharacterized protein n=1 Tax=Cavenderia fasciculata TaxID=261658 RepID=F4PIX3_CACFS|nr:uncharacterized protein DFA_06409 [Cavenderia fasciculata]EGG24259.1 hypothetical protein DFA_06409 [Cavenderia fasciculata]|eukprot:XP_004362110.1 hypothetical protein DFA_06409 [Cavenderia fasciculata]
MTSPTTTKQQIEKIDDDECKLSKYIQSMIIEKVINDHQYKDQYCNYTFKLISPNDAVHLMINKTPLEKQNNQYITFKQHQSSIGSIALVSKWWLKVVQQTKKESTSIKIDGILKESYFSENVTNLRWKVGRNQSGGYKKFNFKRLPLLLPNLQSIDIVAKNLDIKAIRAMVQVINAFPHIQVHLDITFDDGDDPEWPNNESFKGPLKPIAVVTLSHGSYYQDQSTVDYFHQMIDDLNPISVNLGFRAYIDGPIHYDHSELFPLLNESTRQLNIENDFVELPNLIDLVNNKSIHSLKVGIITCPLEQELQDERDEEDDGEDDEERYENRNSCSSCMSLEITDTLEDWDQFCNDLTNNTTLKNLWLEGPHSDLPMIGEPASVERLASPFVSIWQTNKNITVLGLSTLPKIISLLFFSNLTFNQTITTLMLTDGTLAQQYVPTFSLFLMVNQTITSIDISKNQLQPSFELDTALKQNKTIKILNIGGNKFTSFIFDALLEGDSIKYLLIDQPLSNYYHQHRYFIQSKSLLKCFTVGPINYKLRNFYFDSPII